MDNLLYEKLQRLKEFVNQRIEVEGQFYNFSDLIENEIVSEFPKYSHRMRSKFVEGVELFKDLMDYCNKTLGDIENANNSNLENLKRANEEKITTFINDKNQEFTHHVNAKNEEVTNHIRTKNEEMQQKFTEYNSWYSGKEQIIADKLTEIESKLEQFNHVIEGAKATEDKLGLITIKDIRDNVPLSTKEIVLQIMKGEAV